jgi:cyclic-di-GMP phosphodiesterase TipF (flagellum assembly factor)
MLRLGAIFIVLCMVLIAASCGAVLYLLAGVNGAASMIAGLAVLIGLSVINGVTTRARDRAALGAQIADLSRGTSDLARQVAEIGRRTAALEDQGDRIAEGAVAKARTVTEPITAELGELGTLVKQLAQTVALHELELASAKDFATAKRRAPPSAASGTQPAIDPDETEHDLASAAGPSGAVRSRKDTIETVRNAVEANRSDIHLQPIVTLPQRKVRYYEAFTRLRTEDGTLLQPSEFLEPAETAGLMPQIDNMLLLRSVQVVRRLQLKNRDVGVFCNIAASTLSDPQIFPRILEFMDANRALAPSLVLELRQGVLRALGPVEAEALSALRDLGFRFCIDQVSDLRMEPRDLGERGIRYVKVAAPLLLGQATAPKSDIHAADLSDLLGRYGISLIAERIETEAQVVDLLEYDVRFGQGFLFSPPRPVRAEALGAGNAAETPARDGPDQTRGKVAAGRSSGAAI